MIEASVIIPTLGRAAELTDLLAALPRQTLAASRYEVVVVDNSSEGSPRPSGLAGNVRWIHEPNTGLHFARHSGAKAALGNILVYCDDDILPDDSWLENVVSSFSSGESAREIAVVGGRILGRFEESPPSWFARFGTEANCGALSLLDLHNNPTVVTTASVYGCNLAVRKDVLFAVGGFNPDYYNSPFECLSGDGECGLLDKVRAAGYAVFYQPKALVYHRVPARRLSESYFLKRYERQGIAKVYTSYRRSGSTARLRFLRVAAGAREIRHRLGGALGGGPPIYHQAMAAYSRSIRWQIGQLLDNDELRQYVRRPNYLNDSIKDYEQIGRSLPQYYNHRFA